MKGWLLYDPQGARRNRWFIDALVSAARARGLELSLLCTDELSFGTDASGRFFLRSGACASLPDFALTRTIFPLLSQELENAGVRVFNNAETALICNDKRRTHALFASLGVPSAKTYFLNSNVFVPEAFCYPLVLKSAQGHGGSQVYRVESAGQAREILSRTGIEEFLLQEMQTPGLDVRVYLLRGRILAAVRRTSRSDFRSNYSLGGNAELAEVTPEMQTVLSKVYDRLHPTFVGVDFLFDSFGRPLLGEIEDVVGTRMLYAKTDLAVHELFLDAVLEEMQTHPH